MSYRCTPSLLPTVRFTTSRPARTLAPALFAPRASAPSASDLLTPFFRLLNEEALFPSSSFFASPPSRPSSTFTPRFDVRELSTTYELSGELPGLQHADISIEFTDAQTLSIKGRTERRSERSNVAGTEGGKGSAEEAKAVENSQDSAVSEEGKGKEPERAASPASSSYHNPTVEDDDYVDAGAEERQSSSPAVATAATTEEAQQPTSSSSSNEESTAVKQQAATTDNVPQHRYWVSERSSGSFERRFKFPGRVDMDAVKASLKDGILSVVVPKAIERQARSITIE